MAKFCVHCAAQLKDGAKFCPGCGAALQGQYTQSGRQSAVPTSDTRRPAQYAQPRYAQAAGGDQRLGIPAPGFSDRVNHPEILAAVKKNRRAARLFLLILIPLPVLGFVIYAAVSEKLELGQAALYGGIVSGVIALFSLLGFVRERAKNSYDAVVLDKRSELVHRHKNSDDDSPVTRYTTVVRTEAGKKKKLVEWEGSQLWAYSYLNVGDRFRYHPQFHFPYELWDKSKAPYIACVSCGAQNPVEADRCGRCRLPLLK